MKIVLLIIPVILLGCQSLNFPSEDIENQRDLLRSKRSPATGVWEIADPIFDEYYVECIKEVDGATYYPIWFSSINEKMNGIIFKPASESRGTILVIHGYAGNIKGFKRIINELLKEGYTVAALSLPGHGIAGGERGGIDNFDQYGEVVNDFLEVIDDRVPKPLYAISHSTGCSSLIIYNQNYGWDFKKVVFLAPLIRSYSWGGSVVGRFVSRPFVKYFNTNWTGVLAVQVFPLSWFDQLYSWNKRVKKYSVQEDNILIFQGKKDKVVSWKYNTKFVQKKYPNSSLIVYPNGSHTFFMGDGETADDTLKKTLSFFETP